MATAVHATPRRRPGRSHRDAASSVGLDECLVSMPLGRMRLVACGDRLLAADFVNCEAAENPTPHSGNSGSSPPDGRRDTPFLKDVRNRLNRYFRGDLGAIDDICCDPAGTPFQQAVWRRLRQIPVGRTCSYAQIARAVGNPAAARAVGMANHANPIALIIPCHRVIAADGSLGGYGGGLDRKTFLLRHEGAWPCDS